MAIKVVCLGGLPATLSSLCRVCHHPPKQLPQVRSRRLCPAVPRKRSLHHLHICKVSCGDLLPMYHIRGKPVTGRHTLFSAPGNWHLCKQDDTT